MLSYNVGPYQINLTFELFGVLVPFDFVLSGILLFYCNLLFCAVAKDSGQSKSFCRWSHITQTVTKRSVSGVLNLFFATPQVIVVCFKPP